MAPLLVDAWLPKQHRASVSLAAAAAANSANDQKAPKLVKLSTLGELIYSVRRSVLLVCH